MTTTHDYAGLAEQIEALAKEAQRWVDYIKEIPRGDRIPFEAAMAAESSEYSLAKWCFAKAPDIAAALREAGKLRIFVEDVVNMPDPRKRTEDDIDQLYANEKNLASVIKVARAILGDAQ